jgi:hypothetical protein
MNHQPTILAGDCLQIMPTLAAESVDAIVTDPPYGLGFMGRAWDDLPPGLDFAREALRVLKPGGHMLAFGGTRTWHRLAVAIEDAGFEIRDSIAWLYAGGFPKSRDIGKDIDKAAGAEREVVGTGSPFGAGSLRNRSRVEQGYRPTELNPDGGVSARTAPATPEAAQWQGWGSGMKPAWEGIISARKPDGGGELEPIVVARKPFPGTVAANVLKYGTGALNIDATRIDGDMSSGTWGARQVSSLGYHGGTEGSEYRTERHPGGRWPANVVLDEDQAAALQGGASRFYFCAKAPKRERPVVDGVGHPTVKPLTLMRWLCRLVTPPGGIILDPFAGSGATLQAGMLEGFRVIGIENDPHSVALIRQRLSSEMPDDALPFDDDDPDCDSEVVA